MKKIIGLWALLLLTATSSFAFAASTEWLPRLVCENQGLAVDAKHSLKNGITDHQVVIRVEPAQVHLQRLITKQIFANGKGELILQGLGKDFDGNFSTELARDYRAGSGSTIFTLNGRFIGNDYYEIYVTSRFCGPGSCDSSGGKILGNWIFNKCEMVN